MVFAAVTYVWVSNDYSFNALIAAELLEPRVRSVGGKGGFHV